MNHVCETAQTDTSGNGGGEFADHISCMTSNNGSAKDLISVGLIPRRLRRYAKIVVNTPLLAAG